MALDPELKRALDDLHITMEASQRERAEHSEVMRELVRENRLILRRHGERIEAGTQVLLEMRGEIRAQTQAIWRVIDRMDRMDPGGAAA